MNNIQHVLLIHCISTTKKYYIHVPTCITGFEDDSKFIAPEAEWSVNKYYYTEENLTNADFLYG